MFTWDTFKLVFEPLSLPFLIHTIPPVLLFCLPYKRREPFRIFALIMPVCLLLYSVLITCFVLLLPDEFNSWLRVYTLHLLLLLGVLGVEKLLFKSTLSSLLFNLLGGFALYQICLFLFCAFYPPALYAKWSPSSIEYNILLTIWLSIAYFICYHAIIKRHSSIADDNINSRSPALYLSIAISLFLIYFNIIRNNEVEPQSVVDYMCIVCLILFHTSILLLRRGLLSVMRTEKELLLMQKVWEEKEKSLKLTAETANTISIKYHDLKHVLSKLKRGDTIELVAEIAESLKAYEHTIATGNDTLDLVLTEQTLRFTQSEIAFSCMADGKAISFMSSLDIISLFSNALDNAYEAVLPLDKSKKEIFLIVKQAMGMVSICVENPYSSALTLQNGLPTTTKQDKDYHGFGMRSIRSTVEKYGGDLTISTDNNWFCLMILIPGRD